MVSSARSSTALALLALYASSTWAATVSEVFLASIRSARPLAAANSPARTRTCVVDSHNDGRTDDSEYIAAAVADCNNGGHVVFPSTQTYVINTPLDLTNLSHIDLDIQGRITFTDDIPHWLPRTFDLGFQNATSFFKLGGADVHVYGGGTLDGRGQAWWDHYPQNKHDRRPVLFATVGMRGGSVSDLSLVNSPFWHNFVGESSEVVFTGIRIRSVSGNENFEKNTDGWDIYRSDHITVQNSTVTNGDDCVSFKPNSTEIVVQNLWCNGSHGISVGSLGQYKGETDIVENVFVTNITMENASDGARIKVWPGAPAALSGDLQGGGGAGRVNNITYDGMYIKNVDYAIEITQCYGQKNLTLCNQFPSNLTISNVKMTDFKGTTSKARSPYSGYVVCSSPNVCKNILVDDIDVVSPAGTTNSFQCGNVDAGLLHGINCTTIV